MSYPSTPYEIELHDKDGYVDFMESFPTEWLALDAIPPMLAKARAEAVEHPDWYEGCYFKLVKHEVDGMSEWREPIESFQI